MDIVLPKLARLNEWRKTFASRRHVAAPYLAALLAIAVALVTVAFIDHLLREDFKQETRSNVLNEVTAKRVSLEQALNQRLFLVRGLAAYVSSRPEINDAEFQAFAEDLEGEQTGIRSLQLAPDSVVTYVYPVEGNEEAIGHDLLGDPARRDAVQRAIDNREFVIAGPVELKQGGVALIGRTPIFSELPGGSEQYWGLAIILIDFDPLLLQAGLLNESQDIEYVIRGKDGLGASGEVFFGDENALDTDAVMSVVSLPSGSWELAAAPVRGWPSAPAASSWAWIIGGIFAVFAGFVTFYLVSAPARLQKARAEATTDALTGLYNHRAFHERIEAETSEAQESGRPLGLIMVDIDDFKRVNDSRGHQAGDDVLRQLAPVLAAEVGQENAYRYGGDEFALLMPGKDHAATLEIAELVRRAVQRRIGSEEIRASLGVASLSDGAATMDELIYGADAAMYWAKSQGKNRVGDWARLIQDRTDGVLPWYAADPAVHDPDVVAALGAALAAKDPSTMAHTERCSWHAANLARELGLGKKETSIVRLASLLHDIGKLVVPDQILFKPGPLNEEEWEHMKQHPTAALRILGQIRSLTDVTPSIVHHHEHFDGSGYPDGLAGEKIPIASRILLVTDAFDAMTNDRSYRKAMPVKAAVEELTHNKGGQFDPAVVDAFLRVLVRDGAHPPRPDSSAAAEELTLP